MSLSEVLRKFRLYRPAENQMVVRRLEIGTVDPLPSDFRIWDGQKWLASFEYKWNDATIHTGYKRKRT